jgi:RHS repeat-associated protein
MTAMPGEWGFTYDIDNRLLSANSNGSWEQYAYLADNKRVWKQTNQNGNLVEQYYLYGVGGERIATYTVNQQMLNEGILFLAANQNTIDVYFGGRVIWQNGKAVLRDRLGSVMARSGDYTGLERHDYFPYGEERTPTAGDRNKYGTYHRDQTGLDYADQRYYNSTIGRFLSADPYEASGGATEPASWGRGVYVHGDPVNLNDQSGLTACDASGNNCTDRITVTSSTGMTPQAFCAMYPNHAWCRNAPIDPGDPANRLPPPKVNDPRVLSDLAKYYSKLVADGTMTDCAALASYAGFVDTFVDEHLRVDAFKPFLPKSFGGDGTRLEGRVSGYRDQYIDVVDPNGDQAHHFAFFFNFGARLGPNNDFEAVANLLTVAAVGLEIRGWFGSFRKTWKFNTPDVNLGMAAGMFGYEAARAGNNQSQVAYMIRENLCK